MRHEFTIGHMFSGSGGGAFGVGKAEVAIGDHVATFRNLGGVDIDGPSCRDFEMLTGAPALEYDVRKLSPARLIAAWGKRAPDMVLMSPPCKGFSALLSKKAAASERYQQLNRLVTDSLFLLCSTWPEPPALIFMENVPRIMSRGKELLAVCRKLLKAHGYMVTENDTHDCGEIGGLAQHRKRFFMVARCPRRIPNFIYHPPKLRVRACGEVLGELPTPGDEDRGGPMHQLPKICWLNWVRLALIPAGGDWRDLPGVVPEGKQRREVHRRHMVADWEEPVATVAGGGSNGVNNVADPRLADAVALGETGKNAKSFKGRPKHMRVESWQEPTGAVTGTASVSGSGGTAAVADPRQGPFGNTYRVTGWEDPVGTITSSPAPSSGAAAVADPRIALSDKPGRHLNQYNVRSWEQPAKTVTGASRPGSGAPAVADPRYHRGVLGVTAWDEPSGVVTAGAAPSRGRFSVADPRLSCTPRSGAYGVLSWQEAAATITGSMRLDNGKAAVADPRIPELEQLIELIPENPKRPPKFTPVIIAADGTWHRPLTTLELAVLQSFPATINGEPLKLDGNSTTAWRERIGNAIPPSAGHAIGNEMLLALLASKLQTEHVSDGPIWVSPITVITAH